MGGWKREIGESKETMAKVQARSNEGNDTRIGDNMEQVEISSGTTTWEDNCH